ncbi:fimbrial protein [Enterobacter kobei]|uniref:fimbrial protein n=1 Tax=Enterobacter kobei TaxID=208224 RepID=UPI003CEB3003
MFLNVLRAILSGFGMSCTVYRINRLMSGCIFMVVLLYSFSATAGPCLIVDAEGHPTGEISEGVIDMSPSFTNPGDNVDGMTKDISINNVVSALPAMCLCAPGESSQSTWDWTQFTVPTEVVGGTTYGIINDYIGIAILAGDSKFPTWIPYDNFQHTSSVPKEVCNVMTKTGGGGSIARIRIRKRFIGSIDISTPVIYQKGANALKDEPKGGVEMQYRLIGYIDVPESCEINAGQVIDIDLGNYSAAAFSSAGAGNMPAGPGPVRKMIPVHCQGGTINTSSLMTVRLLSENAQGDKLLTDNNDIGIVVKETLSDKILVPNDMSSTAEIMSPDDDGNTVAMLSVYPVSMTGNRPAEGKFSSRGYLRVDFE